MNFTGGLFLTILIGIGLLIASEDFREKIKVDNKMRALIGGYSFLTVGMLILKLVGITVTNTPVGFLAFLLLALSFLVVFLPFTLFSKLVTEQIEHQEDDNVQITRNLLDFTFLFGVLYGIFTFFPIYLIFSLGGMGFFLTQLITLVYVQYRLVKY